MGIISVHVPMSCKISGSYAAQNALMTKREQSLAYSRARIPEGKDLRNKYRDLQLAQGIQMLQGIR